MKRADKVEGKKQTIPVWSCPVTPAHMPSARERREDFYLALFAVAA